MDDLIVFYFTCVTLLCVSLFYLYYNHRYRNSFECSSLPPPPGPWSYPLIGSWEMLAWSDKFQIFSKLRNKYGNIFSVNYGNTSIVVLNDFRLVKEAFLQWEFSEKPVGSHLAEQKSDSFNDKNDTEADEWSEPRRFLIKSLHHLGFGKPSMQLYFHTEIKKLIEDFEKKVGKTVKPHDRLRAATVNPIWKIATGRQWNIDDPEFLKIKVFIFEISKCCKIFLKSYAFPWISKLLQNDYQNYLRNKAEIRTILKDIILQQKVEKESGKEENLIDIYLRHISETTDRKSCFYGKSGEATLVFALEDLLLGGTEATSVALMWALLILSKFPDVQDKIHVEIQRINGSKNFSSLDDRKLMPYTEAVIMEVMRFCGLNPLTHHKANGDTNFHGYRIRKGSTIVANFSEIFRDQLVWGDPQNFRPERFLTVDLKSIIRHEAFLMFSVGKRACPAENFSRDQMFIYLIGLCQHFKICCDPKTSTSTLDSFSGVFRYPKDTSVVFIKR